MGSAEVLAAPTEKVQFMEDMKTEVKTQQLTRGRKLFSANVATP